MSQLLRFLFYSTFIVVYLAFDVELERCSFTATMKQVNMVAPANSILRNYTAKSSKSRLVNVYENFNFTRIVGSEGHRKARDYIVSTFANMNWHVELDAFEDETPHGKKKFTNVIASSNVNANSRLLLACHYDSKDYRGTIEFIGATDSAVPCAIIIDVAKSLNDELKSVNNNISLDLVFFDGEEAFERWTSRDSIYGARHMVKKWQTEREPRLTHFGNCNRMDSINALILLDLIGSKELKFRNLYADNDDSTAMFDQFKTIEKRLQQNNLQPRDIEIFSDTTHRNGYNIEDDHLPFKEKGVTIVHLISVPFPRVWHTKDDHSGFLHWPTIHSMNTIIRVFIGQYFGIY